MMLVTFTIPIRTWAGENQRLHWAERAKRAKSQRHATAACWRAESFLMVNRRQFMPTPPCVVTLTRIAPRMLDEGDNLSSSQKAIRDQIAAELGIDDRDSRVEWRYRQERGKPNEYAVRVEIAA